MERSYSRDFTYIDNVIQANELAAITSSETIKSRLAEYFNNLQPRIVRNLRILRYRDSKKTNFPKYKRILQQKTFYKT
jgi:hypothetical protein